MLNLQFALPHRICKELGSLWQLSATRDFNLPPAIFRCGQLTVNATSQVLVRAMYLPLNSKEPQGVAVAILNSSAPWRCCVEPESRVRNRRRLRCNRKGRRIGTLEVRRW